MTVPTPLPQKFLTTLEEACDAMRLIGQQAKQVRVELERKQRASAEVFIYMRDIEALAYRTAFEIAELQVAGTCDGCPSAPPKTESQAVLITLASELDQRAEYLRRIVNQGHAWAMDETMAPEIH